MPLMPVERIGTLPPIICSTNEEVTLYINEKNIIISYCNGGMY